MKAQERDGETGLERRCQRCGEWWPKDPEFYYFRSADGSVLGPCRACHYELKRERKAA